MNLHLETLRQEQIPELKRVYAQVIKELLGDEPLGEQILASAPDIDDAVAHYIGRGGTFLVLLDGEHIVGMGAVRPLDAQICELKRMWFLERVRGLGWGRKMAQQLIQWSRLSGYTAMRLDSGPEPAFTPAIRLYRSLGFVEVEDYNGNPKAKIWMELAL